MIVLRRAAAIAIVAAGAYALYAYCFVPYHCNEVKKMVLLSTSRAYDRGRSTEGIIRARQNVDALLPCVEAGSRDVSCDMLLAANYRILGRYDEAAGLYRHALQLDRRPEIYINLAAVELVEGDRNAARDHMLRAVLFNAYMLQGIEDGLLRQEVLKKAIEVRPEDADYLRYAHNLGYTQ